MNIISLSNIGQRKLLEIARYTIEQVLTDSKVEVNNPEIAELNVIGCGIFVTLKNKGNLRGCIGCFSSPIPLWKLVSEYSIESLRDNRFYKNPITKDELIDINIEISVLSPPKKIKSYKEAELGKHGIIIEKGFKKGVFLPQVAKETGWSLSQFFGMCALHKAGLHETAYLDSDVDLYIFDAFVFGEKE